MTSKTIFIADDDADLLHTLTLRCRSLGLNVRTASDARTALNSICEQRPDVACLDVRMPAGNGLGVCEMLAGESRLGAMPVIILTGNGDNDTIRRCHDLCAYYVPKGPGMWDRMQPLLFEFVPELAAAE
jgi:CheY-like chemotaxis protein